MDKIRVLFLCTGNSARSQMAEAILRNAAPNQFEVFSAGLEPGAINPLTIQVLKEIGLDASKQVAKGLDTFMGKVSFDYLIIVCSNAEERCPFFPGMGQRLHWPFDDPAAFSGSDEDKDAKFQEIRDQISERIFAWLQGFSYNPQSGSVKH